MMYLSVFTSICFAWGIYCLEPLYAQPQTSPPPNIILIMADDLGYETLGCNGGTSYETPHLNRLAQQGVRFEHAYATPLCTPTRVQLMTGKYNFRNYEKFGYLNPQEKTFAHLLKAAGYQTAIAGKWQLRGGVDAPHHFGFDQYCLWQLEPGDFWYRYKDPVIYENGEKLQNTAGKYGPDIFTGFILRTLEQYQQQPAPFFIYYPMALVHDPFQPTPDHAAFADYQVEEVDDTTYFSNMVHYMDQLIGRIVHQLDTLGLRENTLIIFTGDNGTSRRVISRMEDRVVRGDKGYTTQAGTHVPLIVSWQGRGKAGGVSDALVDFTDFLPTLAEAAQAEWPQDQLHDGQSFLHQVTGKDGTDRQWIFCDYDAKGRDFPVRRYAQDRQWKLYSDGSFYHFKTDLQERNALPVADLQGEARKSYQMLKKALDQYAAGNPPSR